MNFTLGLLDVGDMMQDAVTEHQVEGVIGERQVEDALAAVSHGGRSRSISQARTL